MIWKKKKDGALISQDDRFVVARSYRRTYPWEMRDRKLDKTTLFSTQREAKDAAEATQ